ncbi:uncharacterized protein PAF06_000239 [Gastrophryne carolinensis]
MLRTFKKLFLSMNLVALIFIWGFITYKSKELKTATITPLLDNKTFVVSAYYDARESTKVRVITILHDQEVKELYCWFYCLNADNYIPVRAEIDVHEWRFKFHYGPADVSCEEPPNCFSKFISVHTSNTSDKGQMPVFEIMNRYPQPFKVNFTVCISVMYGNRTNCVLNMIQALEMYRFLGAQKVVIYKTTCSKAIQEILDFYVSEGLVEIIPWPIDKYLRTSKAWHQDRDPASQIGYFGQTVALSDCLYRNMYTSRYVTFNDLDEIILPRMHQDWHELMKYMEGRYPNNAVFLIQNHFYPNNVTDPTFHTAFPKNVPGTNILELIHYEPEIPGIHNAHKMIVNPREVIQIHVHKALKAYKGSVDVPEHIVSLHHNRDMHPSVTSLFRDPIIWKYNASLIKSVNRVLDQLNYT